MSTTRKRGPAKAGVCYTEHALGRQMGPPYLDPEKIDRSVHAIFLFCDMVHTCTFLAENIEEKSDADVFPDSVVLRLVAFLNVRIVIGGLKKKDTLVVKIRQLFQVRKGVTHLQKKSGWHWDNTNGYRRDDTAAEEISWEALVLQHPIVAPFKNSGWALLEYVDLLQPAKPKGDNVFRPGSGTVGNEIRPLALPAAPVPPAAAPATGTAPAAATTGGDQGVPEAEADALSLPEQAEEPATPAAPTRTSPPATAASPATPAPSSRKRAPPAAAPSAPPSAKRQRADALANMTNKMQDVLVSMDKNTDKLVAAMQPTVPPTPVRARIDRKSVV